MHRNWIVERLAAVVVAAVLAVGSRGTLARVTQGGPLLWAEFGVSVAVESGTVFVAASPKKNGERSEGTVHLFERRQSAWVETGRLSAPEATVEDLFGIPMAADGDTFVVGAQFADARGDDSGLAYVFERRDEGWRRVAVLSAGDAAAGDQFGLTVSVSGETIAVGARLEDSRGRGAGAAYVFERHDGTWEQVRKLTASDMALGDLFGRVSVDNDEMMVSADLNDDRGDQAGKAYVFEARGGVWTEVAQIAAGDAAAGDEFGISLALRGGTAVFGAIGDDGAGDNSGAAYVFERQNRRWTQMARLVASDAAARQSFGHSVAADEDTIVVGAPNHGGDGEFAGAAYVFERRAGVWNQTAKLTPRDAARLRAFGSTVAVSNNTIVVGVLGNGDGAHPGAAYIFERREGGWSEVAKLVPGLTAR